MKSKRSLLFLIIMLVAAGLYSQTPVPEVINEQVWRPFIKAYNDLDDDGILAVLSDDMIRVDLDGEYILSGGYHMESIRTSVDRARDREIVRRLDLSFVHRFHTGDVAYESGYYRATIAEDGLQRVNYGHFSVLLERKNGVWKIITDITGSEDGKILEEDFMRGRILE